VERLLQRTPLSEPAREGFRAQLREEFLSQGAAAATPFGAPLEDRPGTASGAARRAPAGRLRRLVLAGLAVAAAVFVTFVLPGESRWQVQGMRGEGPVEIAGRRLGQTDAARLGAELSRGGTLWTFDNTLDLGVEDGLEVRVLPGTEVTLAELPAPGTLEPYRFDLARGEVFIRTKVGFTGNPVLVDSDEVHVALTGTTLGVLRDDRGTCVCVADGEVDVRDEGGAERRVGAGQTYLVFRAGAMPPKSLDFDGPNDPEHRVHTAALVDFLP
jgi:ferric-dicitrate binding protein FerR (iron transport regulator)